MDIDQPADRPGGPAARDQRWGMDPRRRNRLSVRLLLAVAGRPRLPWAPLRRLAAAAHVAVCTFVGADFQTPHFGRQLYLPHPFGVVVHGRSRLGDRVTLYQNVTLGEDNERPGAPTIGDDVVIGAGAIVLGAVTVGDGARIGAGSVVLDDVPPGAVAVGAPARVVRGGPDRSAP